MRKKKPTKSSQATSKWMFWVIGIFSVCVLGFIFFFGNFSEKEASINYENEPFPGDMVEKAAEEK